MHNYGIITCTGVKCNSKTRSETVNALYIPADRAVKSIHSLLQRIHNRSGSNVMVTPNPSYAVDPNSSQSEKEFECQYEYVQPDDALAQHGKVVGSIATGGVQDCPH